MPDAVKVRICRFHLRDKLGDIEIRFCFEDGKPHLVTFFRGDEESASRIIGNRQGQWKPCVTHAKELLRLYAEKPARGNHAKREKRAKKEKPALKLYG